MLIRTIHKGVKGHGLRDHSWNTPLTIINSLQESTNHTGMDWSWQTQTSMYLRSHTNQGLGNLRDLLFLQNQNHRSCPVKENRTMILKISIPVFVVKFCITIFDVILKHRNSRKGWSYNKQCINWMCFSFFNALFSNQLDAVSSKTELYTILEARNHWKDSKFLYNISFNLPHHFRCPHTQSEMKITWIEISFLSHSGCFKIQGYRKSVDEGDARFPIMLDQSIS